MKKLLCGLLCAAILSTTASAAIVDFQIDEATYQILDGETVTEKTLESAPFVNDQWRTMVPIRSISEAFGAEIGWEGSRQEVAIRQNGTEILLYINSTSALVNGAEITLDSAPVIIEGRTFVPLRFVSEVLSYNVNYTPVSRHVVIDNTAPVLVCGTAFLSFAEAETLHWMFMEANRSVAADMGMSENDLSMVCMDMVIDTATKAIQLKNAFSSASLTPEMCTQILYAAETEGMPVPLVGLRDVLYEKLYHASGYLALAHLEETVDLSSFYKEEFVCAKHILVEDLETANKVYADAIAGQDFDSLIEKYNTDPGMETNPGGYVFTRNQMVPSFEEATYGAEIDSITKPVESIYGYHIIKRMPLPPFTGTQKQTVLTHLLSSQMETSAKPEQLIDMSTLYSMVGVSEAE